MASPTSATSTPATCASLSSSLSKTNSALHSHHLSRVGNTGGGLLRKAVCEWRPRREEIKALADGSASAVRRSGPDNAESHVSVGGDQSVIDTLFGDNACDLGQIDNQVRRSSI